MEKSIIDQMRELTEKVACKMAALERSACVMVDLTGAVVATGDFPYVMAYAEKLQGDKWLEWTRVCAHSFVVTARVGGATEKPVVYKIYQV